MVEGTDEGGNGNWKNGWQETGVKKEKKSIRFFQGNKDKRNGGKDWERVAWRAASVLTRRTKPGEFKGGGEKKES